MMFIASQAFGDFPTTAFQPWVCNAYIIDQVLPC